MSLNTLSAGLAVFAFVLAYAGIIALYVATFRVVRSIEQRFQWIEFRLRTLERNGKDVSASVSASPEPSSSDTVPDQN